MLRATHSATADLVLPCFGDETASPAPPPLDVSALENQSVQLEKRGLFGVESTHPDHGYLKLTAGGARLDLHRAMHGAAVCFDTGRHYGRLMPREFARESAPWRTQGPLWHGVVNALFGEYVIGTPARTTAEKYDLSLPRDLRTPGLQMRRFAASFTSQTYSKDMEITAQSLEAKGFRHVRVIERDDALALIAVDPEQRAIVVGFRCAIKLHLALISQDTKRLEENGVQMPRGIYNYLSHIKPVVDEYVDELIAKYPDAPLMVCGGSLGGSAALQWVSRRLKDGTLDPDQIAQVVPIGLTRSVGRERADELRAILGPRLDPCVAHGDWLALRYGAREEHGDTLTRLGPKDVPFKWREPIDYHTLSYALRTIREELESLGRHSGF